MIRHQRSYPKQLQIGENHWDIIFCRLIPGEGQNILGLTDPSEHKIYIKMGQTPEERFKTLIHEIGHALCFEYKIKENHKTIHQIEEPILRLLLDNGIVL
jgi:hypothetical protein